MFWQQPRFAMTAAKDFRKLKIERVGKLLCSYYYKQEIVDDCCKEHKINFESK